MNTIDFPQANLTLLGDQKEVADLRVWTDDEVTISCFQPTPAELEEINRTGVIWVMVANGRTHAPINLMAASPFYSDEDLLMLITRQEQGEVLHPVESELANQFRAVLQARANVVIGMAEAQAAAVPLTEEQLKAWVADREKGASLTVEQNELIESYLSGDIRFEDQPEPPAPTE